MRVIINIKNKLICCCRVGRYILMFRFMFIVLYIVYTNPFFKKFDLYNCVSFWYSKMNQLYIYPFFFRFSSCIGHYGVLSRALCSIQ